jgi:hypothetical protein
MASDAEFEALGMLDGLESDARPYRSSLESLLNHGLQQTKELADISVSNQDQLGSPTAVG